MKSFKGFRRCASWLLLLAMAEERRGRTVPARSNETVARLGLRRRAAIAKARIQSQSRNRRALLFAGKNGQERDPRAGNCRVSDQPVCQSVARRGRVVPEIDARRDGP